MPEHFVLHEVTCPRCGTTFVQGPSSLWCRDDRPPVAQFLHHAQRDHDLDDEEAKALLARRLARAAAAEHSPGWL